MLRRSMKTGRRKNETGMTLIELLFAGFVLTVGMMGSLIMITIAIATNQRNKTDTVGTALGQTVIEQIATLPTSDLTISNFALKDCAVPVVSHTIQVSTGGAPLIPSPASDPNLGRLDFTAAPVTNYQMEYYTCGGITYDVRWNIRKFPFPAGTDNKIVVVGVRQKGSGGSAALFFAPPVNLRTVVGP